MTLLTPRVLRTLHALNSAYPWDHNARYHRWILRRLPQRPDRALDVGSGRGELARLLARRSRTVIGLDADPAIVAAARALTPGSAPVSFVTGRAPDEVPPGPYDVITCVATLHHLPFEASLTCFREHLAPGGTLVVVGVHRPSSPGDRLLDAVAIPLNPVIGLIRSRGRKAPAPVVPAPRTSPATMTCPEILCAARRVLPGARLRRRLFWRHTLVWRRPAES
ncbi:class I SAM-dependent methyltransferase [Streptomyces meridianus]|uniref:Class I SAM-dependent methyltransferase n=1 Tax=Streptomyces meridianus TaxID=2938945 RepID=A0ABT0X5K0_9ACTN|nr:class I SAM-dependent methyltransferase [Streptomyces meridianus]MCM2577801.1 class I SAM-dependent methyltransferase [Streptomyces meridianus]